MTSRHPASGEQLRRLRNRCLRAVEDDNMSVLADAFRKMTSVELRHLWTDAGALQHLIDGELSRRLQVTDRDE